MHSVTRFALPLAVSLLHLACSGDGPGADAPACVPLSDVRPDQCPPTWAETAAAQQAFCAEAGGKSGFFESWRSKTPCQGSLHYDLGLFDGGPRRCIYDPTTLKLRGYKADDGKALFHAITCGVSAADFEVVASCEGTTCYDRALGTVCKWDPSLDNVDASTGACRARRTMLSCSSSNGATQLCNTDDPTRCPDDGTATGATSCSPHCAPNQYAVACGKVGPGVIPDPPAGCDPITPTPGGVVFACCACGS